MTSLLEPAAVADHPLLAVLDLATGSDLPAVVHAGRTWSRADLLAEADALAAAIVAAVPADARVGYVDSPDHWPVVTLVAALRAGRSLAMLPVAHPDDPELTVLAAEARVAAVVHRGRVQALPTPPVEAGALDPSYGVEPGGSPEAVVLYTSGTTSRPRGVRLSAGSLAANLTAMLRTTRAWAPDDVLGQVLPTTHSFGLSMVLLALARRTPVVLLGGGVPSRALTAGLTEHRVTVLACVPYYLRLAARRRVRLAGEGTATRTLLLAGGGLRDEEVGTLLPGYAGDLYLMYGFTEATARVAVRHYGDGAPDGSVGLPLPGTSVQVVDADGRVLAPGAEGLVRVQSPSLMIGYLGEPPRAPGVPVTMTDLGVLDAAGHLTISGRTAEILNFRGNRVSVVAVESVVMTVDGVLDARLVPDSRAEDAACVLSVVPAAGRDADRIRLDVLRAVTPPGLVREVVLVDHLETTRSGKPLRRS